MTTEEKLDRLTTVVESLAASVVAHDDQIEQLITAGLQQQEQIDQFAREWRAYLKTIRPH